MENTSAEIGARQEKAKTRVFRADIQALRCAAVFLVFFTHLWPNRVPGGFAGVDVFFVISGFLITSHLLKELNRTGRINLPQFYARRLRRLLPASFTVLVFSMLGMWLILPVEAWKRNISEFLAATFYGENLFLSWAAVDYHAQAQQASLVQHYWSLSLEEQFYFIWPTLLLLVALIVVPKLTGQGAKELTAEQRKRLHVTIGSVVAVFWLIFFCFGVWFTAGHKTRLISLPQQDFGN